MRLQADWDLHEAIQRKARRLVASSQLNLLAGIAARRDGADGDAGYTCLATNETGGDRLDFRLRKRAEDRSVLSKYT